ncbi:MAG: type II toxin-antitoxin system VapC family toxin [Deltaproteobacteria bacterium]|nr:type II toxin-antitoxin system VapC family toxin [Deltaproteobacteria bacterium]
MRFWDSSAIVPVVIEQSSTPLARSWLAEDAELAVWTLTATEVLSALCRLRREGEIDDKGVAQAETLAAELLARARIVADVELVKATAARLLRAHVLRVADALQLAAALAWAAGDPRGRTGHSLDGRLGLAARREGFRVVPVRE